MVGYVNIMNMKRIQIINERSSITTLRKMYIKLNLHCNTFNSCVPSLIMKQEDFQLGESTLQPPKIVVTKIEILHLVFLGTMDIISWIIFAHFKYIALTLDLN